MTYSEHLIAYGADGRPLPGIEPTWREVRDVATGEPAIGGSIVDAGGGEYVSTLPGGATGLVDLGESAVPRYVLVYPAGAAVFAAYGLDGEPHAGLLPVVVLYRDADGDDLDPVGLAVLELGGGLYRVDGLAPGARVSFDLGPAASPRTVALTPDADAVPPIVAFDPQPGTPIGPSDPLTVTVTDANGLRRVLLLARFGGLPRHDVVYDGERFAPMYEQSSVTPILNGLRFELRRVGGWLSAQVVIRSIAFDAAGNESS